MDTNVALEAILSINALWQRQNGRVTLADLGLTVRQCVRSRGGAALPPERWRGRHWQPVTRHEWVLEP